MGFDLPELVRTVSYLGMFAIVLIETGFLIGFALPGDSLLITVGILAATGQISLSYSLIALFLGSFLGNLLGYFWGRALGPALEKRVSRENLERTRQFIKRFGVFAILVGPYVPIVRALVPFTCGATHWPLGRFMGLTLLGSLLWTQGLTLLAYYLGSLVPHLENYVYLILLVGIGGAVLPALARLVLHRLKSR